MSDDQLNQTQFISSEHAVPTPTTASSEQTAVRKPPITLYLIVGVVVLFLAIFAGTYTYLRSSRRSAVVVATPTPTPQALETSVIRSEIAPLLQKIEESNPENDEHPFPPVDFKIRIKDPGSK